jgi:hypothetical protein
MVIYLNFPSFRFNYRCVFMKVFNIYHTCEDTKKVYQKPSIERQIIQSLTRKRNKRTSSDLESFTVATITWLAVTEYQCHKWPRICSVYRNHIPVLSSCLAYHRVCAHYIWYLFYCCKINTQDLLTPPEHMESSRLLVRLVLLFIFCVVLYRSLLVLLFLFLVSDCIICLSMDGFW